MGPPTQVVAQQLPKLDAWMTLSVSGEPEIRYTFTGEVPKEVMDAYQEVVGNGLARVTVSTDMGIKEFGTGAGAMVSISLTCNQDQATLLRAVDLAGAMAKHFANDQRQKAEQELMGIIAQRQQLQAGSPTRPNYG